MERKKDDYVRYVCIKIQQKLNNVLSQFHTQQDVTMRIQPIERALKTDLVGILAVYHHHYSYVHSLL